jgi:hypothetical protein
MSEISPELRLQLRAYVHELAAEGKPEISIIDGELSITWDRWRRFHLTELSPAEQTARICAAVAPERMLALLEAELAKAAELGLGVTSIALPAARRWR